MSDNAIGKAFFAAANSGNGFQNFYHQVFSGEQLERRYLIKGGPGTGKSTFMRYLAKLATDEGIEVERYLCSSDPDSLDALVLAGRFAVMDATSPHCVDTELAGARDELLDLGAFWSSDGLRRRFEDIKQLSKKKKESYSTAYRFLNAAMTLDDCARAIGERYVDWDKMRKTVHRIAKKIPDGDRYELKIGICDSIGMRGRVRLDTYERLANEIYFIEDYFHAGAAFLSLLIEEAREKRNSIRVSYAPLNPAYPDAVLFEKEGVTFVLCDGENAKNGSIIIKMKRFVDFDIQKEKKDDIKRAKVEYRNARRISEGLICSATEALSFAGEYHFELEKIYKDQMDFVEQNRFCERTAKKIIWDLLS